MATKGSSSSRGYGHRHKELRALWDPIVRMGGVSCAKCGLLITWLRDVPGHGWDLGHVPGSRTEYRGPEHSECNRDTRGVLNIGRAKISQWWNELDYSD